VNDHELPHAIPQLPIVQLPAPPHEVTDGVAALRVACAKWALNGGVNDHNTAEVYACDTVLNRDIHFPLGIMLGSGGALLAVAFFLMCRSVVRSRGSGRIDDVAAYAGCGVLSLPIWLTADIATKTSLQDWSDARQSTLIAGCTIGFAALLALLRWLEQAQARRVAAPQDLHVLQGE